MRIPEKWNKLSAVEQTNKSRDLPYIIALLTTSLIWGLAFVAQSVSGEALPCFAITGIRNLLAAVFMVPVCLLFGRFLPKPEQSVSEDGKTLWKAGTVSGFFLFLGENLQQYGLDRSTTAKAGFITSLYIILVPILGVFLKKRAHPAVWFCACIATAGLYLLSVRKGFAIAAGDLFLLLCALAFAFHIQAISAYAGRVDCLKMACIQFFVTSVLSLLCSALWERFTMGDVLSVWAPLAYTGILSGGVGYSLQIIGESRIDPARTALLTSPESVFAALFGWLLLGQKLSLRELSGCALVFAAVVLSQIPWENRPGTGRGPAGRKESHDLS